MSRSHGHQTPSSPQDIDIDLYSERNVDRFALLLDLWNNEVLFLEAKMKVKILLGWEKMAQDLQNLTLNQLLQKICIIELEISLQR